LVVPILVFGLATQRVSGPVLVDDELGILCIRRRVVLVRDTSFRTITHNLACLKPGGGHGSFELKSVQISALMGEGVVVIIDRIAIDIVGHILDLSMPYKAGEITGGTTWTTRGANLLGEEGKESVTGRGYHVI